jgi:ElaB/YqjD/DUF883 family membrane-anchored ribosome-binding protein
MSHLNRHVKSGTHHSTKSAAEVSDNGGSVVDAIAEGASAVARDVREAAGQVAQRVEEKFEQGRDQVRCCENRFEESVRSRPLASLLIAAGIGVIAGALWRRRQS